MCHIVNSPKHNRFGLLMDGPVASGKGEQSKLIVATTGGVHISTGELARNKRDISIEWANEYGHILDAGKYLPDKVVFELLREFIPQVCDQEGVFVADGLPRNRHQADQIGTIFAKPQFLLCFSVYIPKKVAIKRALDRAEKQGRLDDCDEKIISCRYDMWDRVKDPTHKKMRAKGVHIITVDGDRPVLEVHQTISRHVNTFINRQKRQWEDDKSFAQPKRRRSAV